MDWNLGKGKKDKGALPEEEEDGKAQRQARKDARALRSAAPPIPSREEEASLALRAQAGDKVALSYLVDSHRPFLITRVQRYTSRNSYNAKHFLDCLSEASLALTEAVLGKEKEDGERGARFDPSHPKHARLITYARKRIDGAIADYFTSLGLPLSIPGGPESIPDAAPRSEFTLADDPFVSEIAEDFKQTITDARELFIFERFLWVPDESERLTQEEIGQRFGITKNRVSQIARGLKERLKKKLSTGGSIAGGALTEDGEDETNGLGDCGDGYEAVVADGFGDGLVGKDGEPCTADLRQAVKMNLAPVESASSQTTLDRWSVEQGLQEGTDCLRGMRGVKVKITDYGDDGKKIVRNFAEDCARNAGTARDSTKGDFSEIEIDALEREHRPTAADQAARAMFARRSEEFYRNAPAGRPMSPRVLEPGNEDEFRKEDRQRIPSPVTAYLRYKAEKAAAKARAKAEKAAARARAKAERAAAKRAAAPRRARLRAPLLEPRINRQPTLAQPKELHRWQSIS